MKVKKVSMEELVGKEYKKVMLCKKRYLILKGSRASKKSKNIALRWIMLLYEFEKANLLVIRKYSSLLKQSCRADLIWAIKRIGVEADWILPRSELTMTRRSTGQVILFRGISEPDSLASITVENGALCWAWIEELYQVERESDFDMVDESIRGEVPEGYFKQIVGTFNPWHESSWIKSRFFSLQPGEQLDDDVRFIDGKQKSSELVLALTRNYMCNEWLDKADYENFERMKREQPARYKVAGLGDWGVSGETIYSNWEVLPFEWRTLYYMKTPEGKPVYENRIGLDFGYSHNTAGLRILVDREAREIYVCEELYVNRLSTDELFFKLREVDWIREPIHADSEDPKTIRDLHRLGCGRIFGVKKERGSVLGGIRELQGYKIIVNPMCPNFEIEISHYSWAKDGFGRETARPIKEWDHLMDALRYAMIDDTAGVEFVNTAQKEVKTISNRDEYNERLKRAMATRK